jgi:hypothetical protein
MNFQHKNLAMGGNMPTHEVAATFTAARRDLLSLKGELSDAYSLDAGMEHAFSVALACLQAASAGAQWSLTADPVCDSLSRASTGAQLREVMHKMVGVSIALGIKDGKWVEEWVDSFDGDVSPKAWARAARVAPELLPLLALQFCVVDALGTVQLVGRGAQGEFRGHQIQPGAIWYPSWGLLADVATGCVEVLRVTFGLAE